MKRRGSFSSIRTRIIFFFALFILVLVFLVVPFGVYESYEASQRTNLLVELINDVKLDGKLNSIAQFILYYDESLTQAARNYAFTGNKHWETLYRATEPKLDELIKEAILRGDERDKSSFKKV